MIRIAIIIGSTRPERVGEGVARWVYEQSRKRTDAEFELVDLKDYNLPLLDEPVPAGISNHYVHNHTKIWSQKISSFDAFIFVTAEYNHGIPAALKNAIDFLYQEWANKVAGFVAYGGVGGTRVVEQLRMVMGELQVATVRTQMAFSLRSDFEDYKIFKPAPYHEKTMNLLFDQVIAWGSAIRKVRLGESLEDMSTHGKDDGRSVSLH